MLKYHVPDLSGLHLRGGVFLLERVFRGGGPSDYRAYGLVVNFIRLTDLALEEYELARRAVLDFASRTEGLLHPVIPANHFEACIVALKRALDHLVALKASPHVPMGLKALLPRHTLILSSGVAKKATDMRDAIQHLDEKIRAGEIAEKEPLMPLFMEEALGLGSLEIKYSELASWITELNTLAEIVARYREN